jgi:hypothetical protein
MDNKRKAYGQRYQIHAHQIQQPAQHQLKLGLFHVKMASLAQ